MTLINIQAAKTHLSRLVEDVIAGKDIVLGKAGKPMVRLIPYKVAKPMRKGGQFHGEVWQSADCWAPDEDLLGDAPLVTTSESVEYRAVLRKSRRAAKGNRVAEES